MAFGVAWTYGLLASSSKYNLRLGSICSHFPCKAPRGEHKLRLQKALGRATTTACRQLHPKSSTSPPDRPRQAGARSESRPNWF
ncbi:hypothetical protein BRADI_3g15535v3 [Brachypodium distachyon]|uniref:Uncharacterized protein n=1 Tax=Brachypodium distachyon TaxID=15368 RepID=A0A2K2CXC4_BRADI|nr:hypothetical protein BRADI_3g15535v3 [Brachypodium distachyon]